jgi:hypothetical protein
MYLTSSRLSVSKKVQSARPQATGRHADLRRLPVQLQRPRPEPLWPAEPRRPNGPAAPRPAGPRRLLLQRRDRPRGPEELPSRVHRFAGAVCQEGGIGKFGKRASAGLPLGKELCAPFGGPRYMLRSCTSNRKSAGPRHTTCSVNRPSANTTCSAVFGVSGPKGSRLQRLGSRTGFGAGMRTAPGRCQFRVPRGVPLSLRIEPEARLASRGLSATTTRAVGEPQGSGIAW